MNIFKKINKVFEKKQKKKLKLLMLMHFSSTIIEIFSIALIFPLLVFILNPDYFSNNLLLKNIYNYLPEGVVQNNQLFFICLVMVVFILKYIYSVLVVRIQSDILTKLEGELKLKVFQNYLNRPYSFFLKNRVSQLIVNINISITEFIGFFINPVVGIITEIFILVGLLVLLLYASTAMFDVNIWFILALPAFILLIVLYLKLIFKKHREAGSIATKDITTSQKFIQQGFQSIREVKLFHNEKYFSKKLKTTLDSLQKQNFFLFSVPYYPRILLEFTFIILVFGIILILVYLEYSSVRILTILGGFAAVSFRIFPSLNRITTSYQMIKTHKHLLDILYDNLKDDNKDLEALNFEENEKINSSKFLFKKEIILNNIEFQYTPNSKKILNGLDLQIKKNEFICLFGKSGSGKSTLVDLISGLIKPTEGKILVDDKDIYHDSATLRSWQELISFVPQNIFLLNESISKNISFSDLSTEKEPDIERINKLVKDFELDTLINSLENGLETVISENITNISGGQKQRVAIARAFYKNSEIIIMDEPTNSLDAATEEKIISKIYENKDDKTIIVVSHNEKIKKYCDRVIVIE